MKDKVFYIYLDKTTDGRVFYVGKGKIKRIYDKQNRNEYWINTAKLYGLNREIFLATKNEEYALEIEASLIFKYKTFEAAWPKGEGLGCNLTSGFDGLSGRFGKLNGMYGKTGEKNPRYGKRHALDTLKKQKESKIGLYAGDKNNSSKLNEKQVKEIKYKYFYKNIYIKDLIIEYNVSRDCIKCIVNGKTWKHLLTEDELKLINNKKNKLKGGKGSKNNGAILNEQQVYEIRERYLNGGETQLNLSLAYKVSKHTIRRIIHNLSWKEVDIPIEINKIIKAPKIKHLVFGENNPSSVLTDEKVLSIREKYSDGQYSHLNLAKEFCVSEATVQRIVANKSWKHLLSNKD